MAGDLKWLPALSGHAPQQPEQRQVGERVRQLRVEARLEVREQVKLAAVVGAVAPAAKRDDAIRVVAAAERPRHQVRRIDGPPAAHEARLAYEPSWTWRQISGHGGRRLDHLFTSADLEPAACLYHHSWRDQGLSDHSALEADVKARNRVASPTAVTEPAT